MVCVLLSVAVQCRSLHFFWLCVFCRCPVSVQCVCAVCVCLCVWVSLSVCSVLSAGCTVYACRGISRGSGGIGPQTFISSRHTRDSIWNVSSKTTTPTSYSHVMLCLFVICLLHVCYMFVNTTKVTWRNRGTPPEEQWKDSPQPVSGADSIFKNDVRYEWFHS